MKKLLLLASTLILTSFAVSAQSTLLVTNLSNGNSVISNGMIIYRSVAANVMDQMDINIKNISSTAHVYKMRRFNDLRNIVGPADSANAYFCFGGQCYSAWQAVSGLTESLNPNQDAATSTTVATNPGKGHLTSIHYDEASVAGPSNIRYRIYETSNPSVDLMEFTVHYNDAAASVKTNASLLSFVSDVYPNPSSNKAFITVNASTDINSSTVSILNTLGSILYTKNLELSVGKNVITLEAESLSAGIYFAIITSGNSKTVKKFTINK